MPAQKDRVGKVMTRDMLGRNRVPAHNAAALKWLAAQLTGMLQVRLESGELIAPEALCFL